MFENISVLIPFQTDNGPREKLFKWIKSYYEFVMPSAELCIIELASKEGLFNKSRAVNLAAKRASRDILVIADADIFYNPIVLIDGIRELEYSSWIVPFHEVWNLSEMKTRELLNLKPSWPVQINCDEDVETETFYPEFAGKLNIVRKCDFIKVNGFDERFVGWGGEDDAFAISMNTICGPFKRLNYHIYHLWHPFIGPVNNPNYDHNFKLFNQYEQANGNVIEMNTILKGKSMFHK